MIELVKDLETLEAMLGSVKDLEIKTRFSKSIEELYMEIYERRLTDEERFTVDMDCRSFELLQEGWELDEDVLKPGSWVCKVYQHNWWGHWRVEVWGNFVRLPDWDSQFEKEAEAKEYARIIAGGKTRPWG